MNKFSEGEILKSEDTKEMIYILGVNTSSKERVKLSVLVLDEATMESKQGKNITINKSDFSKWKTVKI